MKQFQILHKKMFQEIPYFSKYAFGSHAYMAGVADLRTVWRRAFSVHFAGSQEMIINLFLKT